MSCKTNRAEKQTIAAAVNPKTQSPIKKESLHPLFSLLPFFKFFVKRVQNHFNDHFSRFGIYGMSDVLMFAFAGLSGRHGYKIAFASFYNLDIVNYKAIVDGYRRYRFKFAVVFFNDTYSYVCNFHVLIYLPFIYYGYFIILLRQFQ